MVNRCWFRSCHIEGIFLCNLTIKLLTIKFVPGHAKEALELSKLQEGTRQQEQVAKIKEYEAAIEQSKVEQKKVDYEERRKTLQVTFN